MIPIRLYEILDFLYDVRLWLTCVRCFVQLSREMEVRPSWWSRSSRPSSRRSWSTTTIITLLLTITQAAVLESAIVAIATTTAARTTAAAVSVQQSSQHRPRLQPPPRVQLRLRSQLIPNRSWVPTIAVRNKSLILKLQVSKKGLRKNNTNAFM